MGGGLLSSMCKSGGNKGTVRKSTLAGTAYLKIKKKGRKEQADVWTSSPRRKDVQARQQQVTFGIFFLIMESHFNNLYYIHIQYYDFQDAFAKSLTAESPFLQTCFLRQVIT